MITVADAGPPAGAPARDVASRLVDCSTHVRPTARGRRFQRPADRRVRSALSFALTLTLAALLGACRETAVKGARVVVHGERGPVDVRVELALTPDQRARGLMWRDHLDRDAGMLFVFPEASDLSFWMKNTPRPLDIIYIDAEGRVVSIAEKTTPYSEAPLPSEAPAQYVLEVNAGFARDHGVGRGSRIELPDALRQGIQAPRAGNSLE